ncbi:MAG: protein kinase [Planctomycetes bacterium]|nr:protein kinase [Planctomycetota bacterium]
MTNPPTGACLTDDLLQQLAHDELSPAKLAEVEEHVGHCDCCRAALELASSDAQWTNEIQPVLQRPAEPLPEWDECEELGIDTPRYESVLQLLGPTDDPNMLGRIGSYEVVGIIGRGGMGVVFKAFDRTLNRFVAIKMLLPHLAESGAARKRFAREGQAAAAVIDDHVLPIYSVAEWQGVPYLVTQYLRGSTLQKRIHQSGPLELKEIIRLGLQTARGLAAAHAQGLVHRDVKPSNILLDGTVERAMLTDFGLARAVDDASITRTGVISGTPQFMSPEQANGEPIDHRSDLFSLGSVLYAMCTGRPPFRAETTFGVLRKIRETSPRPIRETNPDIPTWLDAIVNRLLAKNQAERFATAAEVAELLEQCLAHVQQPTTHPLPPTLEALLQASAAQESPRPTHTEAAHLAPQRRRWLIGIPVAASLLAAGLFMIMNQQPGQVPVTADPPGEFTDESADGPSRRESSPSEPLTEWNSIRSAFRALDSELTGFESEIETARPSPSQTETEPLEVEAGANP